jgi:hypothetical protein
MNMPPPEAWLREYSQRLFGCAPRQIDRRRGTPPGPRPNRRQVSWLAGRRPSPPSRVFSQWLCGTGSPLTVAGAAAELERSLRTAFPVRSRARGRRPLELTVTLHPLSTCTPCNSHRYAWVWFRLVAGRIEPAERTKSGTARRCIENPVFSRTQRSWVRRFMASSHNVSRS